MERRNPAVGNSSVNTGGTGEMIKAPISVQDLRRRIYVKAKAEPAGRFWGLYVHGCKMETLGEAYQVAKANDGAPGIDGVTFEAIEQGGGEAFLEQIRDELRSRTYRPMPNRKTEIPKDGGTKVRVISIPSIRDRVVQGALKLILEPIFIRRHGRRAKKRPGFGWKRWSMRWVYEELGLVNDYRIQRPPLPQKALPGR